MINVEDGRRGRQAARLQSNLGRSRFESARNEILNEMFFDSDLRRLILDAITDESRCRRRKTQCHARQGIDTNVPGD
jgi:hypothetical protein